jgi:large subunit ribosomal protein L5e
VARVTCSKVICQVTYATLQGDRVLCEADSNELRRYGYGAGLANYSAAYATGLLCARRLLKQTGLDKLYAGDAGVTGEYFNVGEKPQDRKPFKAVLDVGLVRTTKGNRVFGAMKGACDGGIHIPHSTRRFPGFTNDGEKDEYNAKTHRDRIFGTHVDGYMAHLKKDSPEDYKTQFSKWDEVLKKAGVDTLAKLLTKVHSEIRKNPDRAVKPAKKDFKRDHAKFVQKRQNADQRRKTVQKKMEAALKKKK